MRERRRQYLIMLCWHSLVQYRTPENIATSRWRTISEYLSILGSCDTRHYIQRLLAHISELRGIQIYKLKFSYISLVVMLQIGVKMMVKITSMHHRIMDMEERRMIQLLQKNMLYGERWRERRERNSWIERGLHTENNSSTFDQIW